MEEKMKTSEFRKYLEEKGCNFKEDKNCFDILNLGLVFKDSNSIDMCITYCQNDLFENIYKYARTPLEEREEEKKYRLSLSDYFHSGDFMGMYLNLNTETSEYTFNDSSDGVNDYKTHFTQKEIDAMPFDTNFFIKEEVQ